MSKKERHVTWCECQCHMYGNKSMHFMACCDLCYQKYINDDGTIDQAQLDILIAEAVKRRRK